MKGAYYNEIDPAAAHILRHMIQIGVVAPGDVDMRSITEVQPDDLKGYTQCHFFAGGGLWSVAARLAGWPDDRPLWTGSCPCQPFSAAGKGLGTDDPRHLWPDFHRLIRARRPAVVMGEQVAGKAGYGWFDGVRVDLEGEGYASRAVDFPACSIDAPHQRNRLYWIAMGHSKAAIVWERSRERQLPTGRSDRDDGALDHSVSTGLEGYTRHGDGGRRPEQGRPVAEADGASAASLSSDTHGHRCDGEGISARPSWERLPHGARNSQRNGTYWSDAEWIICHDDKARRAQSGIRFLVDGLPGRVDLWRVGGNAIVPEAAAEVIAAFMDIYGVPKE